MSSFVRDTQQARAVRGVRRGEMSKFWTQQVKQTFYCMKFEIDRQCLKLALKSVENLLCLTWYIKA